MPERCKVTVERAYLNMGTLSLTPSRWEPCNSKLVDGKCRFHGEEVKD